MATALGRWSAPPIADRDQSYFLFATTREQLDYLRFPLGDMTKPQTRELARRFGLAVADKQDSQDICFVPTGRYTDIIGRLKPDAVEPGDIVDLGGRVIGRHQGIVHFTVGQRRGIGIASSAPLYVVRLDAASRRVVVGPREALRMDRIVLRDVNWIGDGTLDHAASAAGSRFSCVCARRARRSRHGCARPMAATKSNSSPARKAYPRARPACSTMRLRAGARARRRFHPERHREGCNRQGCNRQGRGAAAAAGRGDARIKRSSGRGMAADIDRAGVAKAYERWAPVYDLVFGKVFEHGRQSTIAEADRIGGRILDVGVGTGLSLSDYSPSTKLCGVDISEPMLRKAQSRVRALGLTNVETLAVMDAKHLGVRGFVFRRGGGAICHHRGARSRSHAG